jgi:TolA-binding protein
VLPAVGSFAPEVAQAPPTSLAEEMRLLDAARRVLASGDPQSALSTLVKYERAFPHGALRPEASVLKVRALLAAGDRAGAEALGQRIIEQAPRSEHADAVRAALGPRSNP